MRMGFQSDKFCEDLIIMDEDDDCGVSDFASITLTPTPHNNERFYTENDGILLQVSPNILNIT